MVRVYTFVTDLQVTECESEQVIFRKVTSDNCEKIMRHELERELVTSSNYVETNPKKL